MASGNSCTFPNAPEKKKRKHTTYYCLHQSNCALCPAKGISREKHYIEEHPYETEEYVEIKPLAGVHTWFTLKQDFGRVLCKFWFVGHKFEFFVYTPFNTEELKQYDCSVNLLHFDRNPMLRYQSTTKMADWKLILPKDTFLAQAKDGKASIKVTVARKQQ